MNKTATKKTSGDVVQKFQMMPSNQKTASSEKCNTLADTQFLGASAEGFAWTKPSRQQKSTWSLFLLRNIVFRICSQLRLPDTLFVRRGFEGLDGLQGGFEAEA